MTESRGRGRRRAAAGTSPSRASAPAGRAAPAASGRRGRLEQRSSAVEPPAARRPRGGDARAPRRPEPRLVDRHREVARKAGRRRLAVLLGAVATVALVIGVIAVLHSSLFAARQLRVSGAVHTSYAQVLQASGLASKPPLIDVQSAKVATAIERLPWVGRAVVSTHWPSTVQVSITERAPVAYASGPRGVALIDATGRVLEDLPAGASPSLTEDLAPLGHLLTPPPGETLPASDAGLLAVAAAMPVKALPFVVALVQERQFGIVANLHSGALAVFGTATELPEKMVALYTLLEDKQVGAKLRVDLRVPSAPVLTR